MKWLKVTALVAGALLVLVALVPFLVPASGYIPAIEKEISARLGEPTKIRALRASLLPAPHLTAEGIAIGAEQGIKIEKLAIKPELLSLLRAQKVIRRVEANELVLTQKALAGLASLSQKEAGEGGVRVEQIRLNNAIVHLEKANIGPLDVRVEAAAAGQKGEISLRTHDDTLTATITPEGERFLINIMARGWTAPVGPAIRFDQLDVSGVATRTQAELKTIHGKLYGGTVSGDALIAWDKNVSLKARLELGRVDMKPLAALFSRDARVSGRLDAQPVVTGTAASAAGLGEALRVETPFTVHEGVLHGIDLAGAAIGQGRSGGDTRFDNLSGRLTMEQRAYRFTQLNITSSGVNARGQVTIAPNKTLAGRLDASVAGAASALRIPLTVAGTVDAPRVYPNTSAVAGAAAGTVILGPGLGTAAGAKAGEIVEGLFGKKR